MWALSAGGRRGAAPAWRFRRRVFAGAFFWFFGFGLFFVAGEFDYREHCGVAAAVAEFYYSGVSAVALFEARSDLVEEFFYRVVGLHESECASARGEIALLAQ